MELEWTEEIVQTLLKSPEDVLNDPVWADFVQQIGGLEQFYAYLRSLPLKEKEQTILNMLIMYPGASIDTYTSLLHIHRATFYRHQQALFESLRTLIPTQLTAWMPQQAPPRLFHVPHPLTSLIGRSHETSLIADLLETQRCRLITITGPGGIGKTRIAVQIAHDLASAYEDGAIWIGLSHISALEDVPYAVAKALNIPLDPKLSVRDTIINACDNLHALLIFDNMEHLLDASPLISDLLQAAPYIAVVVTSRVRLRLYGEAIVRLEALSLPPNNDLKHLFDYDAIRLLTARLEAQQLGHQLTAHERSWLYAIATMLEGIPLALELAAASYPEYSLKQISTGLEQALTFLTNGPRDVDQRQQTLEATIAWSYQLLTSTAKDVFDQLGVFAGSWTTEALTAVVGYSVDITLKELQDHHLVVYHSDTEDWSMLETIRAYAVQRLQHTSPDLVEQARSRHLQFYTTWATQIEQHLLGLHIVKWSEKLDRTYPNIKAALDWGLSNPQHYADVLIIASSLWRWWLDRVLIDDGLFYIQKTLSLTPDNQLLEFRAAAYQGLGALVGLQTPQYKEQQSLQMCYQGLAAARLVGDDWRAASILNMIGIYHFDSLNFNKDPFVAIDYLQQSLDIRRKIGDLSEVGGSLLNIGNAFCRSGLYKDAQVYYQEALSIFKQFQDIVGLCFVYHNLSLVYLEQEMFDKALDSLQLSLPLRLKLNNFHGTISMSERFVRVYLRLQEYSLAVQHINDIVVSLTKLVEKDLMSSIIDLMIKVSFVVEEYDISARCFGYNKAFQLLYKINRSYYYENLHREHDLCLKSVFSEIELQELMSQGAQWSFEDFIDAFKNIAHAFEEFVQSQEKHS